MGKCLKRLLWSFNRLGVSVSHNSPLDWKFMAADQFKRTGKERDPRVRCEFAVICGAGDA